MEWTEQLQKEYLEDENVSLRKFYLAARGRDAKTIAELTQRVEELEQDNARLRVEVKNLMEQTHRTYLA